MGAGTRHFNYRFIYSLAIITAYVHFFPSHLHSENKIRSRVTGDLKRKFPEGIEQAEKAYGLDMDSYLGMSSPSLSGSPPLPQAEAHSSSVLDTPELQRRGRELHPRDLDEDPSCSHSKAKTEEEWIEDVVETFTQIEKPYQDCLIKKLHEVMTDEEWIEDVVTSFKQMDNENQCYLMKTLNAVLGLTTSQEFLDEMYLDLHLAKGLGTYPRNFVTLTLNAMARLEEAGKPNLIYNFTRCIAEDRPGTQTPLLPFDRMPFGLIEHQIQFFTHTNQAQVFYVYNSSRGISLLDGLVITL